MRRVALVLAVLVLLGGCGTTRHATAAAGPAVLLRMLPLARGPDRPLPTTIWYPAHVAGRRPIVLFSHGLGGRPEQFAALATGWARAGYVVAAPRYPHTSGAVAVDPRDVRRQPDDAAYVLAQVKALDRRVGDPLAGRLDTGRVVAVGFSAGGTTTLGLLRGGHDPALRAAVSIAGRRPDSPFGGPAVPVLFVHGDRDGVVPIRAGRAAYEALPWPKRFVTIPGAGHGRYLQPGDPAYPGVSRLILGFLRERVPTTSTHGY